MEHKATYLSNLTPLRGIAALLVAVFHFEMAIGRFIPKTTSMFVEKSYLMVDLFFVMSGFIMLHVYGESFRNRLSGLSVRRFFVARFARTYPLHFFTTVLLVVIVIWLTPWGNPPIILEQRGDILPNIFLLQSFGVNKIYSWNIPSWSISAEWGAYLLFPFLALMIDRKKALSAILLLALVVFAYYSIMYLLPRKNPLNPSVPVPHNINTTFDWGFIRGITGFITGMLVYLLYQLPSFNNLFGKDIFTLVILGLLIVTMHLALNDSLVVVLFAALVLNFAGNSGYLHRVCNNRVLQYLGNISYSIYLMQIFPQEPFSHGVRLPGVTGLTRGNFNIDFSSGLLYCVIYLLILVGISSLTYYGIERPCRKYFNRVWG